MQVPWRPANSHVGSRSWAFAVNTVAASALLSRPARCGIYRRFGIRLETNDVYPSCYFHTADISIGPGAIVNHGVYVDNAAHVEIGANVGIATGVKLLTSAHSIGPSGQRHAAWRRLPIDIHDGCWIGAGAIVLAGVTVGQGCIVGAGAVVNADCEPDGLYAGVPARRVKELPLGSGIGPS